jgi:drug/metabolite transporter (DMT)-like permease
MALIWGSTFLAIRIGNESLRRSGAPACGWTLATLLYAAVARLVGAARPRGSALRAALIYGLLNYGVSFALLYWGEVRVASGTSAILYATAPLTTAVAAALFGVQRLDRRTIAGALVGLAGVALIFSASWRTAARRPRCSPSSPPPRRPPSAAWRSSGRRTNRPGR